MMALVASVCSAGFARPPALTVSEWAERHRRLPEMSAARGARWRNETAPYLAGIMDSFLERGVRLIAVMKAAQCGLSEALVNVMAYHIEHRPCPILVCLPTASAASAFSKDRIADMLRTCPEVGRLVSDKRRPSKGGMPESTLVQRLYPGGQLVLVGANTPNSFARWSVRLMLADDCDRIPRVVGAEGDPAALLQNRTASFHDGVSAFVSTPVLKGGRIESIFAATDQRRFHLPCDGCGAWAWTTWNDKERWRVAFDDHDASTARLEHSCGHTVPESGRGGLVVRGEWRATAEPDASGHVGFHLPAMLSPFVTLSALAEKFLAATAPGQSPRRLREFVTTSLAEGWRDETDAVEPSALAERMEESYA